MRKQHVVMNPAYGYLNEEDQYTGFDLQRAALFNDEDVDQLLEGGRITREELSIITFTPDQLDNDVPFDLKEHPRQATHPAITKDTSVETEKFALLNPSYGYLNQDVEYKSFDLEDAAIYTEADMDRLNLNGNDFIKQPFTDKQLEDVPFRDGLPAVLDEPFGYRNELSESDIDTSNVTTPEFDFADFGKGLDDLGDVNEQTHNQ